MALKAATACCKNGLAEIKCFPVVLKNEHPNILRESQNRLSIDHGLVMIHKYYTQVQRKLLVSLKNISYSLFVELLY